MTDDRKDEQRKRPSWQLPQERQPESDAYHIWTPRPLLRSIYWKPDPPPPFETVSATYEIFVDQRAWLTMHEHVWQTGPDRTPFGYLIGDLCEDPNANRRFVTITAALPARFDFREDATDQISREATLGLQLEVERRRGVLAGWYHRHLGGEVAMSESDVATHHQHFPEPWHCAFMFVGGGDRCAGGCFRSTPDAFAGDLLLPFYEMASNESLLARGLKRSYLDWTNYTTVDEVRSEPPPRPRIELPAAAAEPEPVEAKGVGDDSEQTPDADRLVVQPFNADPDEMSDARAAEELPKPEAKRPRATGEPAPRPPETGEAGLDARSDETEGEVMDDGRETGEVDFEAAIDAVRPARIELDFEAEEVEPRDAKPAEPPRSEAAKAQKPKEEPKPPKPPKPPDRHEAGPPADEPPELTADGALAGAGFEVDETAARPRKPRLSRKPGLAALVDGKKRKVAAAAVGGGVLVVAALVAGYVVLTDRGATPEEVQADRAGEAEIAPPADGGAGVGEAASDVTPAQIDSAGRETLGVISQFYGRAVALDDGQATCEQLGEALIAVENAWLAYNADFKAQFTEPLPEPLAERDERLVAGMRDVERLFDESECPRP